MKKSDETRERILKATGELFNESGYEKLTLENIAARSGISKGGLLYHFPSKESILKELFESGVKEYVEKIRRIIDDFKNREDKDSRKKLEDLIDEFIDEDFGEIDSGVMAAFSKNPTIFDCFWDVDREMYGIISECFDDVEFVLILKFASDGYFFSKLFGYECPDESQRQRIKEMIKKMLKERIKKRW